MRAGRRSKRNRHPFKLDKGKPNQLFPYRLLWGHKGETTLKGQFLPVAPLREVSRVRSLAIAHAIIRRQTDGRFHRVPVRQLAWDIPTGTWWLILDF